MQFLPSLLVNLPYINPMPLAGWLVWLGMAGLLGVALYYWRAYQSEWNARTWGFFCCSFCCNARYFIVLWGAIFNVRVAGAGFAGGTQRFNHDDLLRHSVDVGGRLVGTDRGGGAWHGQRIIARGLGYAFSFYSS